MADFSNDGVVKSSPSPSPPPKNSIMLRLKTRPEVESMLINVSELCDGRNTAQVEKCRDSLAEILHDARVALQSSKSPESTAKLKDIEALLERVPTPLTPIVFVGATGAGKSSLINALLGIDYFIPTDCTAACTSVAIEISHHDEEDARARITFIKREDWAQIVEDLLFATRDENNKVSQEIYDKSSDAGIAYSQLSTVYPWLRYEQLSDITVEKLMQDERIQRLGKDKTFRYSDMKKFSAELKDMLSNEKGYWPLIAQVSIKVNAPVLACGIVLHDIPGLLDSNEARAKVSSEAIKHAKYVFACAPCSRVIDNKTTQDILNVSLRKQMQLDGTRLNVTIVGTCADEINVEEAQGSLKLSDELQLLQTRKESIQSEIQALEQQKTSLESPGLKLGSKRKRNGLKSTPQKKTRTGTNASGSPTTSPPGTDSQIPVDKDVQIGAIAVAILRAKEKEGEIQDKIYSIAIQARSKRCEESIRKKFEDDQIKLMKEHAAGQDATVTADRQRDFQRAVDTLSVHLVSSAAFQSLAGNRSGDGKNFPGFSSLNDTGILALRQHCVSLTSTLREEACRSFIADGLGLLIALQTWSQRVREGEGMDPRLQRQEASIRKREQEDLIEAFKDLAAATILEIREQKVDRFDKLLRTAKLLAKNDAPPLVLGWGLKKRDGGHAYQTLRAILRRDGKYTNGGGIEYNFNKDLGAPFKDRMAAHWSIFFTRVLPDIVSSFPKKGRRILEEHYQAFYERNKAYGTSLHQLERMRRQLPNYQTQLDEIARQINRNITADQRRVNRIMVEPVVEEVMGPAYSLWPQYVGKNARQTMVDALHGHVQNNLGMYDRCTDSIGRNMNHIITNIIKPQLDVMENVTKKIAKECNDVGLGPGADVNVMFQHDQDKTAKDQIIEILKLVNDRLVEAANADVSDELVHEDEDDYEESDEDMS